MTAKKTTTLPPTHAAPARVEMNPPGDGRVPYPRQRFAPAALAPWVQFTPELPITVEGIAQVCHEANRALCAAMGDHSQLPWHSAPEWQRASAILGVQGVLSGEIRRPEQSHEAWLAHKRATGWTHGAVKSEVAKTHPAMVEYAALPAEQQVKDFVFQAIIGAVWGFLTHKYPKIVPFLPNGQIAPGTPEGGV